MITLTCRRCGDSRRIGANALVGNVPVLQWFTSRGDLCQVCFDKAHASSTKVRHDATDTSRAAAARIYPKTGTKRWVVLQAIAQSSGGLTDEEMQQRIPMSPNTQRPRRVELVEQGFIRDSGKRRPTSTGDDAIVWEAK